MREYERERGDTQRQCHRVNPGHKSMSCRSIFSTIARRSGIIMTGAGRKYLKPRFSAPRCPAYLAAERADKYASMDDKPPGPVPPATIHPQSSPWVPAEEAISLLAYGHPDALKHPPVERPGGDATDEEIRAARNKADRATLEAIRKRTSIELDAPRKGYGQHLRKGSSQPGADPASGASFGSQAACARPSHRYSSQMLA